jgi:drug/metabolite transporter (DMT)-like permease
MNPATIPVAVLAGSLFAASWAAQHVAARAEARYEILDPRLLVRLCRRPIWLAGRLAAMLGVGVQFLALRLGPLSVVAPLMVTGLVFAVPMEAALTRRRPDGAEVRAVLITGVGIALFLAAAAPEQAARDPGLRDWTGVFVLVALVALACGIARAVRPSWAAAALGLATGTLFGLAAALLKGAADLANSPKQLISDPRIYAYTLVSLLALTLTQNAFQAGRLSAPLVAITLSEPVTALLIGLTVFSEEVQASAPRVVVGSVAAVVTAYGVRKLTLIMAAAERKLEPLAAPRLSS